MAVSHRALTCSSQSSQVAPLTSLLAITKEIARFVKDTRVQEGTARNGNRWLTSWCYKTTLTLKYHTFQPEKDEDDEECVWGRLHLPIETRPLGVFSFPCEPLTKPDRPPYCWQPNVLIHPHPRGPQVSSTPSRFPPTKPQSRNLMPRAQESDGVGRIPVDSLSICHHRHICQLAANSNPLQMCQQNSLHCISISFHWISIAGHTPLLCIHRKAHNSGSPWCASHSCDGEVFVMMNGHMGECLFCARKGLLAGWSRAQ